MTAVTVATDAEDAAVAALTAADDALDAARQAYTAACRRRRRLVAELHADGVTYREIAAAIGVSISAVYQMVQQHVKESRA